MTEKKTLTEGHVKNQTKGSIKVTNGAVKPASMSAQKPSGPPPAPKAK